ncbi:myocyte-specific enhancer factor 2 isoform X1 [Cloeon dipterum]|uniref:myocyte-specific enhancer factor 2 isoform X1 n=1 Tax=Cloeon dipterum TaxID=197152 RepID=UPI003220752D
MGRKKIQISRITDERNRQVTFNKRKFGVMKKAYELSVLCDCEIALIIFSSSNKLYQYASTDMDKVLLKYTEYNEPHESLTNKNIIEALNKKEHKNGTCSPDSPEPDADYQLTPRTEAKYNKIDEEFQLMMQRNQQINGSRVSGMSQSGYTLPVTVPVNSSYGDSSAGLMQSSPQMAHPSVSPRPSSSETDTVYPAEAMLDMSNGYPPSASPLGSASPGPSPGIANKSMQQKQPSPSRSHLRVVIPTPQGPQLPSDEVIEDNVDYNRNPSIPGMSSYTSSMSAFGPQDFSVGNDIGLAGLNPIHSWSTPGPLSSSLGHPSGVLLSYSGLPHLAVSSSTPPPVSSPPVKIKSEPISPPRGEGGGHMSSRPSSTGHLTPTPGMRNCSSTSVNHASPGDPRHSIEYDPAPMQKRSRLTTEGWTS